MYNCTTTYNEQKYINKSGVKDDHLGSVHVLISDKKLAVDDNNDEIVDYYNADVLSTYDYYPMGGMLMPGRVYNPSESRFKYQGQESIDEISGVGNHYSYKYRESDPRKGGDFWSIDPLVKEYPGWSPYCFSQRRTIDGREFEGLEWQPVNEEGENVAPDAGNIARYNWVGYDKFAYQSPDGSISSNPTEGATKIGIGAPVGTVATGYTYGDNWGRKYTSNQYTQSGTISLATLQQDDINTIEGLDASIQTGAKKLLLRSELDLNTSLRIAEGFRSFATQNEYYSRGRTQAQLNAVGLNNVTAQPNAARITNAYGGQSPHNYGLAFDVVGRTNGYNLNWNALGQLGTSLGLEWGGNWQGFQDRPHFEVPNWQQLIPR